jgi:hypothetical protein
MDVYSKTGSLTFSDNWKIKTNNTGTRKTKLVEEQHSQHLLTTWDWGEKDNYFKVSLVEAPLFARQSLHLLPYLIVWWKETFLSL